MFTIKTCPRCGSNQCYPFGPIGFRKGNFFKVICYDCIYQGHCASTMTDAIKLWNEETSENVRNDTAYEFNPNIEKTIKLLWVNGFNTIDSGDGETHIFECDLEFPYIHIMSDQNNIVDDCKDLKKIIEEYTSKKVGLVGIGDDASIQGTYDPVDSTAIITLLNVTDACLNDDALDLIR